MSLAYANSNKLSIIEITNSTTCVAFVLSWLAALVLCIEVHPSTPTPWAILGHHIRNAFNLRPTPNPVRRVQIIATARNLTTVPVTAMDTHACHIAQAQTTLRQSSVSTCSDFLIGRPGSRPEPWLWLRRALRALRFPSLRAGRCSFMRR